MFLLSTDCSCEVDGRRGACRDACLSDEVGKLGTTCSALDTCPDLCCFKKSKYVLTLLNCFSPIDISISPRVSNQYLRSVILTWKNDNFDIFLGRLGLNV